MRELHGPADLSFDEVAAVLSKVMGRKITFVECDRRTMRQTLLDNAVSENATDLMLEMYDAVETGKLRPIQPRSAETTTPTTLLECIYSDILPLIAAPVGALAAANQ